MAGDRASIIVGGSAAVKRDDAIKDLKMSHSSYSPTDPTLPYRTIIVGNNLHLFLLTWTIKRINNPVASSSFITRTLHYNTVHSAEED